MKWPQKAAFCLFFAASAPVASAQTNYAESPVAQSTQVVSNPGLIPGKRTLVQIIIRGLKAVTETEVRSMIQAREWGEYSQDDKDRDRSALLHSGKFSSVDLYEVPLSTTAFRLDIELTEGPPSSAPAPASAPALKTRPGEEEAPKPPWVLAALEIKGNRNAKAAVIRSQIKARVGDLYEKTDLDRDIQSVLSLGLFDRVAADVAATDKLVPAEYSSVSKSSFTVRLTFLVEEKPILRKIKFVGNKKLSKGKLTDTITLRAKDPFDRTKLHDDENKILDLYHSKGFHLASVESSVDIDSATQQVEVAFQIVEGPKARIGQVQLDGVKSFKIKKIARQMKNRTGKVFSEKDLPEDIKKIETFYKNRGYLDFRVDSSSFSFSADHTQILIHLVLTEGPQSRYGDTSFNGYTLFRSSELVKTIEYRKGKLFSQEKFDFTIRNIQELYADKGRLRTRVTPKKTFNQSTGLTDVEFHIEEGNVVYVDHVDVEGNKATKTYVLKREIVIKEGQPFSMSKVQKSREKIMNLGFVDDVGLDIQSPTDPDKADLTFEVAEGKPGMLTAGAGFSSLDGLIGTLSLQHLNLFGRAQRASVQWSFGARVQDYSVSWTTPWLKNKPTSLGVDLFNTRRISPFEGSYSGYTSRRTGSTLRLGPRFDNDKYQLSFSYSFQRITVSNVQTQFASLLPEGTSSQSSIGAEFARDTRDSIWDPTRGTRNAIGIGLSGGPFFGQINYWRPSISNAYHRTLFSVEDYPVVMSVSNRGGYITPFGATKQVPVFERFFVGGQDSLRGYSVNGQAGAQDGGNVYDVFNVELGFPLARERRRTIVKFVTFFDAGSSWRDVNSMTLHVGPDQRDIKTDIGFGIRFTTPAFPIRLDWGYGLNHGPGEQRYQINFGLGNLF